MDQGSTRKRSAVHNFAPTVTKFCVMWEGQALPHDTKFSNCRCEIVGRRVIFIWSLIHGSSWSGLIKAEPGFNEWHIKQYNTVMTWSVFCKTFTKYIPYLAQWGQNMGCILWVQTLIYTLPQSLQWCILYHVIFDHVITALDGIKCVCVCVWFENGLGLNLAHHFV